MKRQNECGALLFGSATGFLAGALAVCACLPYMPTPVRAVAVVVLILAVFLIGAAASYAVRQDNSKDVGCARMPASPLRHYDLDKPGPDGDDVPLC